MFLVNIGDRRRSVGAYFLPACRTDHG